MFERTVLAKVLRAEIKQINIPKQIWITDPKDLFFPNFMGKMTQMNRLAKRKAKCYEAIPGSYPEPNEEKLLIRVGQMYIIFPSVVQSSLGALNIIYHTVLCFWMEKLSEIPPIPSWCGESMKDHNSFICIPVDQHFGPQAT